MVKKNKIKNNNKILVFYVYLGDLFMSNIVNEKVEDYIRNTLKEKTGLLKELEDYAHENNVPIIHKEVSDMLNVLLKVQKPKRILEVGCAIGYSSIFFADTLDGDVEIITAERNEQMIEKAKENFKRAELEDKITILEGDAEENLAKVEGEFDMIFIDAAKGQYKLFYDMVIDKLKVGGLLISDNILYKGMIAHDDFVVRRKRTIVKRMRNYLDFICNCDYLTTSLIPIGDGVALSYKEKEEGK
jgi:predicted O-methyltransferase YrrM